jgi:GT2 family glycosyltransferase
MSLVAMAVFDTAENGRSALTARTLNSLYTSVDWDRHRLVVSDNGSYRETLEFYADYLPLWGGRATLLENGRNIGTAAAINRAWRLRQPGEHCVKLDNDVEFGQAGWLEILEEAVRREPRIGICGLKRKDLDEYPGNPNSWYASSLHYLPQKKGERCIIVEKCHHIMGTCQLYASALLDKIGYLYQMQDEGNVYGFDDSLASIRSTKAGFWNVFVPYIEIDHIDPGGTPFQRWKEAEAGRWLQRFFKVRQEFESGKRPVYWADPV